MNEYDKMAPEYRAISEKRAAFIGSVNQIVIKHSPPAPNYLDAGAGDGVRGMEIAEAVGARRVSLIDNSVEMYRKLSRLDADATFWGSIVDFDFFFKYGLITCLWSVLGHMDKWKREESLRNLRFHLDGVLVLDLNNRLNINYGLWNVIKNIFRGGEFPFGDETVYVHNYWEAKRMIKNAGLRIEAFYGVDYNNGRVYPRSKFRGQMVFVLRRT